MSSHKLWQRLPVYQPSFSLKKLLHRRQSKQVDKWDSFVEQRNKFSTRAYEETALRKDDRIILLPISVLKSSTNRQLLLKIYFTIIREALPIFYHHNEA